MVALSTSARDKADHSIEAMNQYLLRDGSQISINAGPEGFDVLSFQTTSGKIVHAALSAKAEKALLKLAKGTLCPAQRVLLTTN